MFERLLEGFSLTSSKSNILTLTNPESFIYTLSLINPTTLRLTISGPDRPLPPHNNLLPGTLDNPLPLPDLSIDESTSTATFTLGAKRATLRWVESITLIVKETLEDGTERLVYGDLPNRNYLLNEHGIVRYSTTTRDCLHLGLGEKGAPLDLTNRGFELSGCDGASYDAYHTDPLYKHTPFLITAPKPYLSSPSSNQIILPSPIAVYSTSNSDGIWDVHRQRNDPHGYFTTHKQDWGGMEEFLIFGDGEAEGGKKAGVRELVQGFAKLVGKPMMMPRQWSGYLASGMGLGEAANAQELLTSWPELCKKHDIPCSAIHLSSGYTVEPESGNRYVFTMNTDRYPDFKAMTENFHKHGISVCPNIKPYVLNTHPDYKGLYESKALFYDPKTKDSAVTRLWSSGIGESGKGGWVDMTSKAGREWWSKGVASLVDLGCDTMWNDNNEFLLHNDTYECKNEGMEFLSNPLEGQVKVGLMGRMINTEMMGKASHDTLLAKNPDRRPLVVTRSGNVGTFKYAASTWSGDNYTCWRTLQGSVAMGLNAGMSLIQAYGTDVGGFAGPLPSPELFVRWVQYGVTNSRFCIHAFKPDDKDPSGASNTNLPWMYPEVLPIIRKEIKRRYEIIPYLNNLNWESHESSEPPNSWLGYGEFASDITLYGEEVQNGFDYWMGTGKVLVAGAFHEGETSKRVYFPKSSPGDTTSYIRIGVPKPEIYTAGSWETVQIPLESFATFARAGTIIPIGKDVATVTASEGIARTAIDGVKVLLDSEGGVVSLDDWRGVEIYPEPKGPSSGGSQWIEDDGISLNPTKTIVKVDYTATDSSVSVKASFMEKAFDVAWGKTLWVMLPIGDARKVEGASETQEKNGRTAYKITVA